MLELVIAICLSGSVIEYQDLRSLHALQAHGNDAPMREGGGGQRLG